MNKNTSIIIILVAIALAVGAYAINKNKATVETPTTTETPIIESTPAPTEPVTSVEPATTPETQPTAATSTFTLAQVATHSTEADCYSSINGIVYDLSAWINKHPGGSREILRICGKDGSKAFDGQHGGDMKAENILAGFEIGTLVK